MKKVFLFLVVLILLSGCGVSDDSLVINEKNVDKAMENYDDRGMVEKINDLKNKEPQQRQSQEINKTNNNQMKENNSTTLRDLTKEYDSAIIKTNLGDIRVKFYSEVSPLTVNNFLNLAQDGFYDNTRFHRVINDFMIQGGDPNSKDLSKKNLWGTGDPGYKFDDEFNNKKLIRGSLAMANSGPDTNGSQFFIVTAEATPWLDNKHTNFGEITGGMDVVEKIEVIKTDARDCPLTDIIVKSIELLEK
ncbi:MAG: peptidylprolyl isomerase [Patescibacteria group bacterium]|nr:peptidylprolyl isomerase [Patescibacteria group bacterium]